MNLRILALATAAGGLALATTASASGPHGGGIGLGGGVGIGAHGGPGGGGGGPMMSGGLSGSIGPGMSGQAHIGGGAPGLGPSGAHGGLSGSLGPGMNSSLGGNGRVNSQGPVNASATGIAHADSHSVLFGATPTTRARGDAEDETTEHGRGLTTVASLTSGTLSGVADGQTVQTSSGATVGTVSKILVNAKGAPVAVLVKEANGETVRLPASSLTFANNVVTTSSKRAVREAAETTADETAEAARGRPGAVTSVTSGALAGLAVGDAVKSSSGASVGTVARILTSHDGTVRAVMVTTASGKHFALPARSLSVSGSTVTTTQAMVMAHR